MEFAKEAKISFVADVLENGDTLLARSRYLLFKKQQDLSASQVYRGEILFRLYPVYNNNDERAFEEALLAIL